ncbi:hypothetical protein LNTAR_21945 [Lentisphaera araneosa HTCC2155]|uniref:Orotate phosphoribosyltransferase n=1 Tax=Lentisphaera araneosa HTCC2155 TaxID=313628 RepID=A6DSK0_9BACT|nr:DUF4870 domain-containing protein [Lentisphaera araneosa]EDM25353.1 hypothetical protein LNTAR_21945 [Lentisphaera araneosa HTCC2155]
MDEIIIDPADIPKEEKTNAMICHLLAFIGFAGIPFGGILGPLIFWVIKKDESDFLDACGKEAINFQIAMLIYSIISIVLCLILIGYLMLFALLIVDIVCIVKAANAANRGELYKYPWSLRLIK